MISTLRCRISSINFKTLLNYYSTARESRMLKKMIRSSGNTFRKTNYYNKVKYGHLKTLVVEDKPNSKSERLQCLSLIYGKRLIDALQRSSCGVRLTELGIHISEVNVFKKKGLLDVSWYALPNLKNEDLDEIFTEIAAQFKKELGLTQFGQPYQVRFIRDKVCENNLVVDKVMENPEFKKDLDIADTLDNLDLNIAAEIDNVSPEMKNDIYDLNHSQYFENILRRKKKNMRSQEDRFSKNGIQTKSDFDEESVIKFDKYAYEKFYRKKEALKSKELRHNESKIYNPAGDMNLQEGFNIDWKYGKYGEIGVDFEKGQNKSMTYNPDDDKNIEEKLESGCVYGEDGEISVDFENEYKNYIIYKMKAFEAKEGKNSWEDDGSEDEGSEDDESEDDEEKNASS